MLPEQVSVTAPAKVNLGLSLPARYRDGFHFVSSLMVPISLADRVTVSRGSLGQADHQVALEYSEELKRFIPYAAAACEEDRLSFSELSSTTNLAVRAAEKLFEFEGIAPLPLRFVLHKAIPPRSGLGGGSSDAAAALIGVNRLLGLELSAEKLYKIGAKIGSDVCAALSRAVVYLGGRGSEVAAVSMAHPLQSAIESLGLVVVRPAAGISTPWAYSRFRASVPDLPVIAEGSDEEQTLRMKEERRYGLIPSGSNTLELRCDGSSLWSFLETVTVNAFEFSLAQAHIGETLELLRRVGAKHAFLSGSGSACVGVFDSPVAAKCAQRELARFPEYFAADAQFLLAV